MNKIVLILLCVLIVFAGCTKEYKLKPKLELGEALGRQIQQAMIDFGKQNPEHAELVGRTIEGKGIRITDKFNAMDKTVQKFEAYGMTTGKQLFVGDWVLNQEKMLIASTEVFGNGTQIIYQAPFTITDGKVTITKIKVDKSSMPVKK